MQTFEKATEAPPKKRLNIGFMSEGVYYLRCGPEEDHTMTIDNLDKVRIYEAPIEQYAFVWSQLGRIYPIYIEV